MAYRETCHVIGSDAVICLRHASLDIYWQQQIRLVLNKKKSPSYLEWLEKVSEFLLSWSALKLVAHHIAGSR
jgi:hypothetical protein